MNKSKTTILTWPYRDDNMLGADHKCALHSFTANVYGSSARQYHYAEADFVNCAKLFQSKTVNKQYILMLI